jgi:tetratricopeptide (TPR) repeat protein
MGELIVVELRGIDPDRGEYLLSDREQARGKSEVLALIDRLAARARKKLAGDRGPSNGATPVAQLVTANLEANRWYETGRSLEEHDLFGAAEAYRKAIALDPEFALAHYALAAAASRARAPASALGAIATTAIKVADRAPWREARLIRAWNATVEQRVDDARALYREVLERYPDDKEVLALGASVAGSPEETLAYLQRALQADPMYVPAQEQIVGAMCDLSRRAELIPLARTWLTQPPAPGRAGAAAVAFMAAGELDDALEAARREDLLSPVRVSLEVVHLARREYREAERVARERIARSGRGYVTLANALIYQGRRREAIAALRAAAGIAHGSGSIGYVELSIASGDAPPGELRAHIRELVAAQPQLDWFGAFTLAVAGDLPGAEGYARGLTREGTDPTSGLFSDEHRAVRTFVQALEARERGDAAGFRAVLRDFVASRRWKVRTVAAFALGQTCAEDGDLECAVAALRQYRAEPLPDVIYRPWMLPRSARLLAEVLERQGKADEARRLAEGFLSDWHGADPDLLDLARARALCARLHCQPAPKATVTP